MPVGIYLLIGRDIVASVEPKAPIPGRLDAEVTLIDPVLDTASGAIGARLALPNPDGASPGGRGCEVVFPFNES